ncbi:hypothetical protein D0B54_21200 [Solimonas sp. K1W22B-7]|uniref:DUF6763 family protein n=1 Tax=Solimonas sp. K1W22B-7 TaxID=2303331 RepID=UPI000E337162|nr:DUF6763 family protein [Solimonas sp. K1W22B-7]AXQ31042.1 hypothetical protein D0B54_21200 [Solimonas sp. K1W22B-7]
MAEWLREMSVGKWFQTDGEPFEIVGLDTAAEVVLVQHFDGTLEELDFDTWVEISARSCAPPEDYSGALDIGREDYGINDEALSSGRWDNPADFIDQMNL